MVGVLSDSYFIAADIVRRRVFADFALAHTVQFDADVCSGQVRLNPAFQPPVEGEGEPVCKSHVLRRFRADAGGPPLLECWAIGDNLNDLGLLRLADRAFAIEPKAAGAARRARDHRDRVLRATAAAGARPTAATRGGLGVLATVHLGAAAAARARLGQERHRIQLDRGRAPARPARGPVHAPAAPPAHTAGDGAAHRRRPPRFDLRRLRAEEPEGDEDRRRGRRQCAARAAHRPRAQRAGAPLLGPLGVGVRRAAPGRRGDHRHPRPAAHRALPARAGAGLRRAAGKAHRPHRGRMPADPGRGAGQRPHRRRVPRAALHTVLPRTQGDDRRRHDRPGHQRAAHGADRAHAHEPQLRARRLAQQQDGHAHHPGQELPRHRHHPLAGERPRARRCTASAT